jgi:hypothetical protein
MGSPFASTYQTDVPILSDPPHVVTIRRLTGREFEQAQGAHLAALIAGQSARSWSRRFQAALEKGVTTNDEAARLLQDPLNGFDRITIVKAGVVKWDYPDRKLPHAIDDLDDDTLEALAIEILRLTKPAWFQTEAQREVAEKEVAAAAPGA